MRPRVLTFLNIQSSDIKTSPRINSSKRLFFALAIATATASVCLAKSSDRSQPMDINSDRSDCSLNDNEQCKFMGNVVITQGTLRIESSNAVIHRENGESSRAVLTGSPVKLTQKLDNGSTFNANATTVDYNLANETVILTGSVSVDQPGRGSMASQKIIYDLKTGRVESGGTGSGRVSLRMLPKSAKSPTPNQPAAPGKP